MRLDPYLTLRVNVLLRYPFGVSAEKVRRAICSQVARILGEEREKRGISMTALAQEAGLSQQMISYVERKMRNPTLDTLLRMTAVFKIDLAEIIRRAKGKATSKRPVEMLPPSDKRSALSSRR